MGKTRLRGEDKGGFRTEIRPAETERAVNAIRTVCVYSASSTQAAPCYVACAEELGALLAREGIHLVNGAGDRGLMRVCADAVLAGGGEVTGVIPRFMVEQGWCHPALTHRIETADMHERKQTMLRLSDGVIALPGGCGTMEELLEAITWRQLGLYRHPVVLLNANRYYEPLLQMLRRAVDERFMRPQHASLWQVASTPAQALELLRTTPLVDENQRNSAAL